MIYEKQLTRMFEENGKKSEKALSVISHDVVHIPGSIINDHDIMLYPGKDILDIQKVGNHLIAITPYNILVNHGEGISSNTKKYDLEYTMIGNQHVICNNNKNMIMHIAYNNNVIRVIEIKDDNIVETNMSLWPNEVIMSCWSIHYQGNHKWYVLTKNDNNKKVYIHYTLTNDPLGEWGIYESSTTTYNNLEGYLGGKPTITQTYFQSGGLTIFVNFTYNNKNIKFQYGDTNDTKLIPNNTYYKNVFSDNTYEIIDLFESISLTNSILTTKIDYGYFYKKDSAPNDIYINIVRQVKGNGSNTVLIPKTKLPLNNYKNDDIVKYTPKESSKSLAYGNICHIPYGTTSCYVYEISYESRVQGESNKVYLDLLYTLNLKDQNFNFFMPEPHASFKIHQRGLGDEKIFQLKTFYYASGIIDFFSRNYNINGFLYTYLHYDLNTYGIRQKNDVTNKFIVYEDDNKIIKTYIGNGADTNIIDLSEYNNIPKMITIKDNDSTGECIIFPILNNEDNKSVAFCNFNNLYNPIIFNGDGQINLTFNSNNKNIEIICNNIIFVRESSEQEELYRQAIAMNINGHNYTINIFKGGE